MSISKVSFKLFIIIAFVVLSIIPLVIIGFVVDERQGLSEDAKKEISKSWGKAQTVVGPIFILPYQNIGKDTTTYQYYYILPDELKITSFLEPQIRYRSIYKAVLYESKISISGTFSFKEIIDKEKENRKFLWNDAFIVVGLSDMKGMKKEIALNWNDNKLIFNSGVQKINLMDYGIHASFSSLEKCEFTDINRFSYELSLNGSESINFIPVGKTSNCEISSPWKDPSFEGAFLPSSRYIEDSKFSNAYPPTSKQIGTKGFKASWDLTYYEREYPQYWTGYDFADYQIKNLLEKSKFGVGLFYPVDFYQQVQRTVKYGILIIALTFFIFFLFETLAGLKIHPIQYLFVGFAICVFYLLLLSLAEYLNYTPAYLIGGAATIFLISFYSRSFLGAKAKSFMVALFLSLIYGCLFMLIQLEDYALLIGSILLFLILAIAMYLTRKIDWYSLGNKDS